MGPWEKYADPPDGPWAQYQAPRAAVVSAPPDPDWQRQQAVMNAAADTGAGEAVLIGGGRAVDKILAGMKQVALSRRATDKPELDALAVQQNENDRAYAGLKAARPMTTAIGEASPLFAVPASAGVTPLVAAAGAMEAMKYGTPQERLTGAVSGSLAALGGAVAGRVAGSVLSPVTQRAAGEANRETLDAAARVGVRPRMSQVTGSPLAARFEDFAARVPGGAGRMRAFENANQQAVNRAAAKAIGESADELTPRVLGSASQRIGRVFEDIKALPGKPIHVDSSVGKIADDILRQQGKMLGNQRDAGLASIAEQAKTMALHRGRMDGETYQLIRSGLSEAAFDASGTNRVLYGKLLNALDNSAEQSLKASGNAQLADALRTARPQYANLKLLEKGAVAEAGQVSPARVASAVRAQNPAAFREGRSAGELIDIARVGEGLKALQAGSPTVERAITGSPVAMGLTALPAWLMARGTTSPLLTAYPQTMLGRSPIPGQIANPAARVLASGMLGQALPFSFPITPEN